MMKTFLKMFYLCSAIKKERSHTIKKVNWVFICRVLDSILKSLLCQKGPEAILK